MNISARRLLSGQGWLLLGIAWSWLPLSAARADPGAGLLQEESEDAPEAAQELVGHWRMAKIVFESPRDEHLVLHADGTAENWIVTASGRGDVIAGSWRVEDKTLALLFEGDQELSLPFTFHEGQLVFPNIPNQRGFWERIE